MSNVIDDYYVDCVLKLEKGQELDLDRAIALQLLERFIKRGTAVTVRYRDDQREPGWLLKIEKRRKTHD